MRPREATKLTRFRPGANNGREIPQMSKPRRAHAAPPPLAFAWAGAAAAGDPGRPAWAYVLAGGLALVALYLVIRLFVWDSVNRETPNQEEPLFRDPKEPIDGQR